MSAESSTMPAGTPASRQAELDRIWSGFAALRTESIYREAPATMPGHLTFGSQGNSAAYRLWGWSHDEPGFNWSISRECFLALHLPGTAGNWFLNVRLDPLLTANIRCQRISVSVDQSLVARWHVSGPGHYFALLPATWVASARHLVFQFPDAASPKSLGLGEDERDLGAKFHELWLSPWTDVAF